MQIVSDPRQHPRLQRQAFQFELEAPLNYPSPAPIDLSFYFADSLSIVVFLQRKKNPTAARLFNLHLLSSSITLPLCYNIFKHAAIFTCICISMHIYMYIQVYI
ncbi:unnamed protein product [Ceratitis capitata]|uniref:(Mediterranean fruit fly) hypothetical protein n=1 Tax=Ceratitis capitata TaxID=7213 RepID=A0A811U2L0_CERCA|nr:unnamed protein product [Ceratitis capitata]